MVFQCHCSSGTIPTLPQNAVLEFLAEGAANVIYKIFVPSNPPVKGVPDGNSSSAPSTPPEHLVKEGYCPVKRPQAPGGLLHKDIKDPFHGKLLRLRKDLPHIVDTETAQNDFMSLLHPLFDEKNIVHQNLVYLNPKLVEHLNSQLRLSESVDDADIPAHYPSRPQKRQDVYLAKDDFGLLITDMSPPEGSTTIEFKPKWLAQSPSAPLGSLRCRSCARRAVNISETASNSGLNFCPMSLLQDSVPIVRRAVEKIIVGHKIRDTRQDTTTQHVIEGDNIEISKSEKIIIDKLAAFFQDQNKGGQILSSLELLQRVLDDSGIDNSLDWEKDGFVFKDEKIQTKFCTAMTLRDCTIYIRFVNEGDKNEDPEIRIGDLDFKSPKKAKYWHDTDTLLVRDEWYEGRTVGRSIDYKSFRGKAAARWNELEKPVGTDYDQSKGLPKMLKRLSGKFKSMTNILKSPTLRDATASRSGEESNENEPPDQDSDSPNSTPTKGNEEESNENEPPDQDSDSPTSTPTNGNGEASRRIKNTSSNVAQNGSKDEDAPEEIDLPAHLRLQPSAHKFEWERIRKRREASEALEKEYKKEQKRKNSFVNKHGLNPFKGEKGKGKEKEDALPTSPRLQQIEKEWAEITSQVLDCFMNPAYKNLMMEIDVKDGGIIRGLGIQDGGVIGDSTALEEGLRDAIDSTIGDVSSEVAPDSVISSEQSFQTWVKFFDELMEKRRRKMRVADRKKRLQEEAQREMMLFDGYSADNETESEERTVHGEEEEAEGAAAASW